jgi:hypothetical protein
MRKLPVERDQDVVRDADPIEVLEPEPRRGPFVSFRYSCTEISAHGGKAHLRARSARFEDGRLTSETFEGELDRGAWERATADLQRQLIHQMTLLWQPLSLFLRAGRHRPDERD